MSLQDQITADTQALADAQAKLAADTAADQAVIDAAAAKLAADQAALAAIQPHLSLLDQIESELTKVEDGVSAELQAALDAVKVKILPFVEQMRSLFTA